MECFLKSDGFEGCFAPKLVPKSTFRLPYVIETEKATYEELYFEIHMNRYGTAESRGRKINMKKCGRFGNYRSPTAFFSMAEPGKLYRIYGAVLALNRMFLPPE